MRKMSKAIIVGANGYLARNLIYIITNEYPSISLKLYDKDRSHLDGYTNYQYINALSKDGFELVDLDCDFVFFFIGRTGTVDGFSDIDTYIDVNEKSLLYFLNAYRKKKSRAKIIFPSTRLMYGKNSNAEECDVTQDLNTVYAINKFACEQYIKLYSKVFDVKFVIFRICIPFGNLVDGTYSYGTTEFMLKRAKEGKNITLFGDGSPRRTLTYIGDLCRAITDGALSDDCINDVYNIGGEDLSLKQMAELIADKYTVDVEYVPYPLIEGKIESGDTVFNDNKLLKVLGDKRRTVMFSEWITTHC